MADYTVCTPRSFEASTRVFDSGATRDTNLGKLEHRRFKSFAVDHRFHEYMNKHRTQSDGSLRDPDNWKRGIPLDVYADSLYRHVHDLMLEIEKSGFTNVLALEELLCAVRFNTDGMLHELLKTKEEKS